MHYYPGNNVVRRMQCTGNIFTRWDVQGEDRLTPVKLDHSFPQQAFTEAVLGARHCRLNKTSRVPHATDRLTRDRHYTWTSKNNDQGHKSCDEVQSAETM